MKVQQALAVLLLVGATAHAQFSGFGQARSRTSKVETRDPELLEPPRPDGFEFLGSLYASETRPEREEKPLTSIKQRPSKIISGFEFFSDSTKNSPKSSSAPRGGKSSHFSSAKFVPDLDEDFFKFAASEPQDSVWAAATKDEQGIRCTKLDKKPVTSDDVFRGRFRRDASQMTCYRCEDLKKGGTYEKCISDKDPKNKAYFSSFQKSYGSKSKPKTHEPQASNPSPFRYEYDHHSSPSYDSHDYSYDGPSYSSSDHKDRYEIPEYLIAKSRNPEKEDYTPKSSEYSFAKEEEPKISSRFRHPAEDRAESQSPPKTSEYSYSSSKVQPTKSYSYEATDPPVSFSYETELDESLHKPKGKRGQSKPTEYSYSSSKEEPRKSFHYETTDKPSSYSYSYDSTAPKESKKAKAPTSYSYSSSKVEPTRTYHYESTDKPVLYSYSTETTDAPSHVAREETGHKPKASEYSFSKTVDEPLKTFYQSSSYGDDDGGEEEEDKSAAEPARRRSPAPVHEEQHAPRGGGGSGRAGDFVSEPSEHLKQALGEFHNKNRTHCKKVQKDKMTCWQCVDSSGTKHEECMYVASTDLHPQQQPAPPTGKLQAADSTQQGKQSSATPRRRGPSRSGGEAGSSRRREERGGPSAAGESVGRRRAEQQAVREGAQETPRPQQGRGSRRQRQQKKQETQE